MPLDQSFIGRTYPPSEPYEVGREKIREFASAIGATEPEYFDVEAARALGYADVVAPPTYPISITWPSGYVLIDDPKLGLDFARVLHADQRFAYQRPVVAGDQLICTVIVDDITARGGHDFLTTRTEVHDQHGEHVLTTWTKLVVRGES